MKSARVIRFYDTTLRDGEQTPYVVFSAPQKLKIARALADLGMDIIEVGFPAASESEAEAVKLVSSELHGPVIAGLARARIADIEITAKALEQADKSRISIVLPVSDRHLSTSLNLTRSQAEEQIGAAVRRAAELVEDVEFIATDATRTEYDDLLAALEIAAQAGATTLVVADTVGVALPEEFGKLIASLKSDLASFPQVKLGVHCHDDFGLAVANSLSGLQAGANQVEGTFNGLGERAGNAALEELAVLIHHHGEALGLATKWDLSRIITTSKLVQEISGVPVQPNKAIVGRNAFLHAAGMHQQAMLRDPLTFEPFNPALVGAQASLEDRIIFGKFLGRSGLKRLLALDNVTLSDEALDSLVARVRKAVEKSVAQSAIRVALAQAAAGRCTSSGA